MFYLVECIIFSDDTKPSNSIYCFDNLDDAIARYHKELGGWGYNQKENVENIVCIVMNSAGGIYENNSWHKGNE